MKDKENKTAGFSILEMMIGLAVGLIVVAAATASVVNIIKSNREITDSARLNQELGAVIAVMSNEIRRAGFSVCDVDSADFECHYIDTDGDGIGDTEDPFLPYTPGDTIKIGDGGDCIEYRYNADGDGTDDMGERRGFRLFDDNDRGVIQIADLNVGVTCGNAANWVPLTDPNVINITIIPPGLSFSTTGSRCQNNDQRWSLEVKAADDATVMPCDTVPTADNCSEGAGGCTAIPGDQLFGNILITINLDAVLTSDPAVSKSLTTSVKVANPRIEDAP